LRLHRGHHRPEALRRPRHGAGDEPALPGEEPGPRVPPPPVHRPDRPEHRRLDVDPRSHVQHRELDAGARGPGRPRLLVAGQRQPGHGLHHRGEHLAGTPLLRDHAPGRAPDDPARPLRGGGHRRRQRPPALPARDAARDRARPRHRDDVLGDLHLLRLPARLRADPRRPRQRHASLRHLRLRRRHVGRPARHGGGRRARDAARARRADRGADALPAPRVMVDRTGLGARALRLYGPLALFLVAMLFPFYWMAITSIKPNRELYNARIMPLIVHQPVLKHYVDLLSQTNFLTWTYNTLLVAVVTTVVSLVLGVMIAYPLARMRFPGAAVVAIGVAATYLVPQPLLFIPMSDIINRLDLGNTLSAVMLTYPTLLIPFSAWLLMGYFKS